MRISDATKIPKMLSAKALLIILPLLILVGGVATFALAYASEDPKIKDVVITNVTYNSATVTWETETPVKGRVVVSKSSENKFPNIFEKVLSSYEKSEDDRNIEQIETGNTIEYSYNSEIAKDRTIHHVSIRNLSPSTEYVFQIDGNLKTFGGEDYRFTTLENPVSIQDPKTVYGDVQVVYVDKGGVPQQIVTEDIDGVVVYSVEGGIDTKVMSTIIGSDAKWTADISYPYGVYQQNSNEDTIPEFSATVKTQAGKAGISTYDFISPVGDVAQIDTVSVIVEQGSNISDDVSVSAPTSTRGTGGSCNVPNGQSNCAAGLLCCDCSSGVPRCSAPGGNCSSICVTKTESQERVKCFVPSAGRCTPFEGTVCGNYVNRYNTENECKANHYNRGTGASCTNDNQCSNNNCCGECGKCAPDSNSSSCSTICPVQGSSIECYRANRGNDGRYSCARTDDRLSGNLNECQLGDFKFFSDCNNYSISQNKLIDDQKITPPVTCYKFDQRLKKCVADSSSTNSCDARSNAQTNFYENQGLCEQGELNKQITCYTVKEGEKKRSSTGSVYEYNYTCVPEIVAQKILEDKTTCSLLSTPFSRFFDYDIQGKIACDAHLEELKRLDLDQPNLVDNLCYRYKDNDQSCDAVQLLASRASQCIPNGSITDARYFSKDVCETTSLERCFAECGCRVSNNKRNPSNAQEFCEGTVKKQDCRTESTVIYYPAGINSDIRINPISGVSYSSIPNSAIQEVEILGKRLNLLLACEKYDGYEGWRVVNFNEIFSIIYTQGSDITQQVPISSGLFNNSSITNIVNEKGSPFSFSAQPPGPETITPDLLNRGVYKLDIEGYGSAEFTIYADGIKVQYFEDISGDGIKQENEPFIDLNQYQIQISKQQELKPYVFNTGWNSVTFNIISQNLETASEVVTALSAQGIRVEQISRLDKGQWLHFVVEPTASGVNSTYGTDFKIIPGQGYFIRTLNQGTVYLTGNTFESSVPIALESGWNLIGVQSPTKYTVNQFLDVCNSQNASCVNISRYDQGVYDSVVIDNGVFFGNNFEIKDSEGYFLLNEGGGVTIRP